MKALILAFLLAFSLQAIAEDDQSGYGQNEGLPSCAKTKSADRHLVTLEPKSIKHEETVQTNNDNVVIESSL